MNQPIHYLDSVRDVDKQLKSGNNGQMVDLRCKYCSYSIHMDVPWQQHKISMGYNEFIFFLKMIMQLA